MWHIVKFRGSLQQITINSTVDKSAERKATLDFAFQKPVAVPVQ